LARMVKGFVGTLGAAFPEMSSCHGKYTAIYTTRGGFGEEWCQ